MSLFTLATEIQLVGNAVRPRVITETAALTAPTANQVIVSAYLADADDFRKAEVYRGWDMLYRGWKSFAYDPLPATDDTPNYLGVPIASPNISQRKITTDLTIDVVFVEGDIVFGIGSNLADPKRQILLIRTAFQSLRDFYLESRA